MEIATDKIDTEVPSPVGGVLLGIRNGRLVALRGDPQHPTTKGLVCAKALFLPKIVHSEDRLTFPQIRREGRLERATWDEAMALVADRLKWRSFRTRNESGICLLLNIQKVKDYKPASAMEL